MTTIVLQGHITVSSQELSLILAELPTHIKLTRNEVGCLTFEVKQDKDNGTILHVYEEFVDRKALEAHQHRVKNSRWGKVSANAERNYKIL